MKTAAAGAPAGSSAAAIRVADLDSALAAAEAAGRLDGPPACLPLACLPLACLPLAGGCGPGWFWALGEVLRQRCPDLALDLIFDAGDEPGTALAALRRGFRRVVFTGAPEPARKLAEIAAARDAEILAGLAPVLDLSREDLRKPAQSREGNRAAERSFEWLAARRLRRAPI